MLAPHEMSDPAADGLVLKGTLTYPTGRPTAGYPLVVQAHQYPATRDSFAPIIRDLLDAFGAGFVASAHRVGFGRNELLDLLRKVLGVA